MKVSCNEGIGSHVGPESCGDDCKVVIEALTGESAGRVIKRAKGRRYVEIKIQMSRVRRQRRGCSAHEQQALQDLRGSEEPAGHA